MEGEGLKETVDPLGNNYYCLRYTLCLLIIVE